MRSPLRSATWSLTVCLVGAVACSDRVLERRLPEEPEDTVLVVDHDAGSGATNELSGDPNAVLGVDPTHGPFEGGQTVVVRGNGFTSAVRVWFGEQQLSTTDVIALDPNRLQVRVPAAPPGPVDVSVQIADDEETRRTLPGGYHYDAFVVEPSAGPVSGGNRVSIAGMGTAWTIDTLVTIDRRACEVVSLEEQAGVQQIECVAPAGTPGAKVVSAENPGEGAVSVTGAYLYVDGANSEGGITGEALDEHLQVTVRDDMFGEPLPGISVVLGNGEAPGQIATTDDSGFAAFAGELGPSQTVTVAGSCIQPLTVAAVPSDTLVLYVQPMLTPACLPPSLEIPSIGGSPGAAPLHTVRGDLTWGTGIELKQASWRNVPPVRSDEDEHVAYVFELAPNSSQSFSLPSRIHAVTPDDVGALGYGFDFDTRSTGNLTLYALAGVETRAGGSRRFTPYVMGVLAGVSPTDESRRPVIPMDIVLDHELGVALEPPLVNDVGPDRVELGLLLRIGRSGFIPLPLSERTELLPVTGPLTFSGVPALAGGLRGAEYVVTARAVTSAEALLPFAEVEAIATRTTDRALEVGGFIEVPRLEQPQPEQTWDGSVLSFDTQIDGDYDLWTVGIGASGDLFQWRVIAPASVPRVELPDLRRLGVDGLKGPVTLGVAAARVRDFDYATLSQTRFRASGWSAYSADVVRAHVAP